jgi:arginyl-tRNA--protein-N-Asp/Glu arginylyltransferase
MYAQVHCPQSLAPEEVDHYLQSGWFRMGQTIFTTNFLNFKDQYYSAIWLRLKLKDFLQDGTQKKLAKRNSNFRIEIQQAVITPEKEGLFAKYKDVVSFNASASLHTLLYGKAIHDIYDTWEINIYDGSRLIASGFFDLGGNSAAGISCFYDPDYKKYSLGKYLIYLKISYCKQLDLEYFYPGYFVPGYSFFDYKVTIGTNALQYLQLRSQQWQPFDTFSSNDIPLDIMLSKLKVLQALLAQSGVVTRLFKYEYFEANLFPDLQGEDLFDFPVFLCSTETTSSIINPIIVYDVRDQRYYLLKCVSLWSPNSLGDHSESYSAHLLKMDTILFSSNTPEEIVYTQPLISMRL